MDCLSALGRLGTAIHSLHKLKNWANVSDLVVADELNLQWTLDPKVAGNDSDQC